MSGANQAFSFAMEQVCYERHPDFEAIASHGGVITFEAGGLDRIRRDLANRRLRYEASKVTIVEEIVCDAYALVLLANSHAPVWHLASDDVAAVLDGFLRIARSYFLIMALADLHHAMIKRVRLSIVSGVEAEKPADFADMHFRKIAMIYSMTEFAMTCLPESMRQPDAFQGLLPWFVEQIGIQKYSIDALVVMPVTRVIFDALRELEGVTMKQHSIFDRIPPWQGRLDVLFGREWPASSFNADTSRGLVGGETVGAGICVLPKIAR